MVLVGLPPDCFGLGLDALLSVEDDHAAIENAQRALHFRGEVDMTGRVNEIDGAVAPLERDTGAVNGNAALLFFFVVVGLGRAGVNGAEPMRGAGVIENVLGGCSFAGIDMGNDSEVANLVQIVVNAGHGGDSKKETTEALCVVRCLCGLGMFDLTRQSARKPCSNRPS